MNVCRSNICKNCTCNLGYVMPGHGRFVVNGHQHIGSRNVSDFAANANFAPRVRPKRLVRHDPFEAIEGTAKRFEESLNILS